MSFQVTSMTKQFEILLEVNLNNILFAGGLKNLKRY